MRWLEQIVKYKQWECKIGISHYENNPNRPAIVAIDARSGEPIATFTRNIDDLDYYPPGEVIIDVNNCGQEAVNALMTAGIIGPEDDKILSGYCAYPCHKLLV